MIFQNKAHYFGLEKKDKNLTKPDQIIVDIVTDKNMILVILLCQDKNVKKLINSTALKKL